MQTTEKPKNVSGMKDWCHQFDLSKPIEEAQLANGHLVRTHLNPLWRDVGII